MAPPLSYPFLRYMESSRHLVLYRLDSSYPIPPLLHLPLVEKLCIVDCAPRAISSILYRPYFPNLRRVDYLSVAPSDGLLYRRFPSVKWVFPWREKPYPFYEAMMEAGRGQMEQGLLHQYLHGWYREKGVLWFDLYLPGRGIVSGKEYVEQQRAYLYKKHCDGFAVPYPILPDNLLLLPAHCAPHTVSNSRWVTEQQKEGLDTVFDRWVLNLPDATPYRSSGR